MGTVGRLFLETSSSAACAPRRNAVDRRGVGRDLRPRRCRLRRSSRARCCSRVLGLHRSRVLCRLRVEAACGAPPCVRRFIGVSLRSCHCGRGLCDVRVVHSRRSPTPSLRGCCSSPGRRCRGRDEWCSLPDRRARWAARRDVLRLRRVEDHRRGNDTEPRSSASLGRRPNCARDGRSTPMTSLCLRAKTVRCASRYELQSGAATPVGPRPMSARRSAALRRGRAQ